jgi:hypothetical protein
MSAGQPLDSNAVEGSLEANAELPVVHVAADSSTKTRSCSSANLAAAERVECGGSLIYQRHELAHPEDEVSDDGRRSRLISRLTRRTQPGFGAESVEDRVQGSRPPEAEAIGLLAERRKCGSAGLRNVSRREEWLASGAQDADERTNGSGGRSQPAGLLGLRS